MNKFRALICDLFFVVSAVVGVGFATGKEIEHFFLSGRYVLLSVVIFVVFFIVFSWIIIHIKNKYDIDSTVKLNSFIFGKHRKLFDYFLLFLFVVTSSAMLSGCDNILCNVLNINMPIFSMFLSMTTFFIILGGIKSVRRVSNIIMPILILIMLINVFGNFNKGPFEGGGMLLGMAMPILFCGENCVTLISVLLKTKSNSRALGVVSGMVLGLVILVAVFAINGVKGVDMPLVNASRNIGRIFYLLYIVAVICALFVTLQISAYNSLEICAKNKKDRWFTALLIMVAGQALSFLGFTFIVKYLYAAIGALGVVYIIIIFIKLLIIKINNKK